MHYVYVLKSVNGSNYYIGQSDDLKRRFREHNAGQNISTKADKPWDLVYYEAYISKKAALLRENKLKHHGQSWRRLKERLQNTE